MIIIMIVIMEQRIDKNNLKPVLRFLYSKCPKILNNNMNRRVCRNFGRCFL